jgi:GH15 family glucan-1,4-alpha-glucosidase
MSYQPIENYGVIGDLHTVALVGMDGSIDWLCLPRFDSPSVFAAILDDQKGGRFQIALRGQQAARKQLYWPETNVLLTRFHSKDGVGEIADYMPVERDGRPPHELVRRVKAVRGTLEFNLQCHPAFNYARDAHLVQLDQGGASFHSGSLSLGLASTIPLEIQDRGVVANFTLQEGESATFVLRQIEGGAGCGAAFTEAQEMALFNDTIRYWRRWISGCTYQGRWREMVYRSALVLKLLTYEPTGAIVAAPTCGLPEFVGGPRNWDYRFTWIRDAAFTVYSLMRIGFVQEAAKFMEWIEARCRERDENGFLQNMYGISGSHQLDEIRLDHLSGYRNSAPVRVGNAAHSQLQLDVCGELMDSVYLYNKYGIPISYDLWQQLRGLLNWVCDNWHRKDYGIWEIRGGPQHFVYSKVMCWVALDRGLRLAERRSLPADRERWLEQRDAIYNEILRDGWDDKRHVFTQYYGSQTLDAATLIMPLVFFMSPGDPRMLQTLDAINRPPDAGGLVSSGLVFRYHAKSGVDGLEGDEGSFNICTFWLVEALTRAGRSDRRRLEQAELIFDQMLGYANHLGLYAEETGQAGEALGNFPQAFTHLSLISAAVNLNRALSGAESDWPGIPRQRT